MLWSTDHAHGRLTSAAAVEAQLDCDCVSMAANAEVADRGRSQALALPMLTAGIQIQVVWPTHQLRRPCWMQQAQSALRV